MNGLWFAAFAVIASAAPGYAQSQSPAEQAATRARIRAETNSVSPELHDKINGMMDSMDRQQGVSTRNAPTAAAQPPARPDAVASNAAPAQSAPATQPAQGQPVRDAAGKLVQPGEKGSWWHGVFIRDLPPPRTAGQYQAGALGWASQGSRRP